MGVPIQSMHNLEQGKQMDMQLSEEEKHKICELENFDLSENAKEI